MAGEERTHRRPRVGLAPILLVEQIAGIELGPAVPAARLNDVHQIAGAEPRSAAAFVKAIVGNLETAVGRESPAPGVADTPRPLLARAAPPTEETAVPGSGHLPPTHLTPRGDPAAMNL